MATVTGLTAERMLAIEGASVVDGDVVGNDLILTKHNGTQINAGDVRGPAGPQGAVGQDLAVLIAAPVLDVGTLGQIRAGRQLTAVDFTGMGLSAPIGLYNLSDLSDASGNGRALLNKGAVPFGVGINGLVSTCAQYAGSSSQTLYISDTGAADPFRIKTGSVGCWVKSAKRDTVQYYVGKLNYAASDRTFGLLSVSNVASFSVATAPTVWNATASGTTDVNDDRWHFLVGTYDGSTTRLYVDGVLEGMSVAASGPLNGAAATFNIGSQGGDASQVAGGMHYGRIDEAFITSDVLSDDQIRNLYCARLVHTLAAVPSRISLNVHRRRKGAALTAADFTTQPVRLHNFSAGSLGDEGSGGVVLTNAGAISVVGVDGTGGNAFSFTGGAAWISATDAGLPAALATRSFGAWFKTASVAGNQHIMQWGATHAVNDTRVTVGNSTGGLGATNGSDHMAGPFVADGQWHHFVVVEDNAPGDGLKRKLYVDGRLTNSSTVMNSITLGGVGKFRMGVNIAGTEWFTGQIDSAFVCNYAMTMTDVAKLYAKGSQDLGVSPKNAGDHIERMDATSLLAVFDVLESQHTVDVKVAA